MKTSLLIFLLSLLPMMSSASDDPRVVGSVDFSRYTGLWYEIAHAPNFFQRGCVRSTAEYAAVSPGVISVKNVCYKENGSTSDIEGTATVTDPAVPAKLKVRFNFFARGDYWITHLDPDYGWAVVSGPGKKSIFILARKAPMAEPLLSEILAQLRADGFDVDSLIFDRY